VRELSLSIEIGQYRIQRRVQRIHIYRKKRRARRKHAVDSSVAMPLRRQIAEDKDFVPRPRRLLHQNTQPNQTVHHPARRRMTAAEYNLGLVGQTKKIRYTWKAAMISTLRSMLWCSGPFRSSEQR
jgi:hypothetical protein